ncbi:MAG: hypothetical protein GY851_19300 [bacterium]|nr:hypothetical protein [bacterium]
MNNEIKQDEKPRASAVVIEEMRASCAPVREALQLIVDSPSTTTADRVVALKAIGELEIQATATARDLYITMMTRARVQRTPPSQGKTHE